MSSPSILAPWRSLIASSVAILINFSAMAQNADDATFNGLADRLHCFVQTSIICYEPDLCIPTSTSNMQGNVWISLKWARIAADTSALEAGSGRGFNIRYLEVSKAVMNKPLYVKFAYPETNKENSLGLLVLTPAGNGSYAVQFGGQRI